MSSQPGALVTVRLGCKGDKENCNMDHELGLAGGAGGKEQAAPALEPPAPVSLVAPNDAGAPASRETLAAPAEAQAQVQAEPAAEALPAPMEVEAPTEPVPAQPAPAPAAGAPVAEAPLPSALPAGPDVALAAAADAAPSAAPTNVGAAAEPAPAAAAPAGEAPAPEAPAVPGAPSGGLGLGGGAVMERQQSRDSPTPAAPAESDPLAGDEVPSRADKDSDFRYSEDEEGEGASGGRGSDDSDYVFSDEEDERKRKRWMRPTPEGARRSRRLRNEGEGETAEGGGPMGLEGQERRPQETSTAQPSRAASEDISEAVVSPLGLVVKREVTAEQAEAEVKAVQGMWEMASILDFLRKFKPQIKLSRDFGADELERVLVTSAGDGGLLADVHIDLMRGISPKSEVSAANWAVHLANKIKYHWKALADGTPCPFKPEKYFEAATYAMLPTAQRVRALNFLCAIRADKEDIQERLAAAENPKPAAPKPAAPPPSQRPPRPLRGQSRAPTPEPAEETLDSFRKEPTGVDASGIAYYYFDMADSIGFRLYREIPVELLPPPPTAAEADGAAAAQDGAGAEPALESRRRERKGRRKKASGGVRGQGLALPDPPAQGKWELLASTVEELQTAGERLASSAEPQDRDLGNLILGKSVRLVKDLQARQEAEERRLKAERRVQKKLGVDVQAEFGRARRERRSVNYAFTDYDDVIRSAIKRSARRDESPDDLGRGRRRAASPPRPDPVLEAQRGLRRGRSAAAIHEEVPPGDLNERQLRLMARSRSASGVAELQQAGYQDQGQQEWEEWEGGEAAMEAEEQGGSMQEQGAAAYAQQPAQQPAAAGGAWPGSGAAAAGAHPAGQPEYPQEQYPQQYQGQYQDQYQHQYALQARYPQHPAQAYGAAQQPWAPPVQQQAQAPPAGGSGRRTAQKRKPAYYDDYAEDFEEEESAEEEAPASDDEYDPRYG